MGRLVRDPDVKNSNNITIAKFTVAIDRRVKQGEDKQADFINCVAFGKQGEFVEKYIKKGTKVLVEAHVMTGSYKKQDGTTVYTTDFAVDSIEFAESKNASQDTAQGGNDYKPNFGNPAEHSQMMPPPVDQMQMGFLNVPPSEMQDLPFGAITR